VDSDPETETTAKPPNIWLLGMRPRTLTMAAVPVIVGAVLAWAGGYNPAWVTFIATLTCAVLIQIGTNLLNDAKDGERGADGPDRIGPLRITGAGLAEPKQVRLSSAGCPYS
jgi:1,4-dihydroxy-2-naphthoate octaprenyltransferase